MKARTPTLIAIGILTTLIMGAVFLQAIAQTTALSINVVFDPKSYAWNGAPSTYWNAEIWRQKVQDRADYSTIKLEGLYSPAATPYPATHGPRLVVPFSGADVKDALYAKLPSHMGVLTPGTYKIYLKVSGNLQAAYGSTPFEGEGLIIVTVLP